MQLLALEKDSEFVLAFELLYLHPLRAMHFLCVRCLSELPHAA